MHALICVYFSTIIKNNKINIMVIIIVIQLSIDHYYNLILNNYYSFSRLFFN